MRKVMWVVSYRFCSKFHTLSNSAKIGKSIGKSIKIRQSYRELKGGNSLSFETQCISWEQVNSDEDRELKL